MSVFPTTKEEVGKVTPIPGRKAEFPTTKEEVGKVTPIPADLLDRLKHTPIRRADGSVSLASQEVTVHPYARRGADGKIEMVEGYSQTRSKADMIADFTAHLSDFDLSKPGALRNPDGSLVKRSDIDLKFTGEESGDLADAMFDANRQIRGALDSHMRYSLTLGDVSKQEAIDAGFGFDRGENDFQAVPQQTMYHATTALDAVMGDQLRTPQEIADVQTGLGNMGSLQDSISVTEHRDYAERIAELLVHSRAVAADEITFPMLMDEAKRLGISKDELTNFMSGEGSDFFQRLEDGIAHKRSMGYEAPEDMADGSARAASWHQDGWLPDPDSPLNTDGTGYEHPSVPGRFLFWKRYMSDVEMANARLKLLNAITWLRKDKENPVMTGLDAERLLQLDPKQIGVVEVKPKPGVHGYTLPAEYEWRLWTGDALEKPKSLAFKANPVELTRATSLSAKPVGADTLSKGVMVAVPIPPGVAKQLAVPGGHDPADLHITLGYVGKLGEAGVPEDADTVMSRLLEAVQPVAAMHGAMPGSVNGYGMFAEGENGVPAWVSVDAPGLNALREAVVEAMGAAQMPARADHGFAPHVTVAYVKPGDRHPRPLRQGVPVTLDRVLVKVGQDRMEVPLTSDTAALARVVVPPYLREREGHIEDVSGYSYDRRGGRLPGITSPRGRVVHPARLVATVPKDVEYHRDTGPLIGLKVTSSTVKGSIQTFRYLHADTADGERVAEISYSPMGTDAVMIDSIGVAQKYRGKGIAVALLEELHRGTGRKVIHGSFASLEGIGLGVYMASHFPEWNELWLGYDKEAGASVYWKPGTPIPPDASTFDPLPYGLQNRIPGAIKRGVKTLSGRQGVHALKAPEAPVLNVSPKAPTNPSAPPKGAKPSRVHWHQDAALDAMVENVATLLSTEYQRLAKIRDKAHTDGPSTPAMHAWGKEVIPGPRKRQNPFYAGLAAAMEKEGAPWSLSEMQRLVLGLADHDPDAMEEYRAILHPMYDIQKPQEATPKFREVLEAGIEVFLKQPEMQKWFREFGHPTGIDAATMTAETDPNNPDLMVASAKMPLADTTQFGFVTVYDHDTPAGIAAQQIGWSDPNVYKVHNGLLEPGHGTTAVHDGMRGILRHEYGHIVENNLSPMERRKWFTLFEAMYKEVMPGLNAERQMRAVGGDPTPVQARALSAYAMESESEAFAEMFAYITAVEAKPLDDSFPTIRAMEKFIRGLVR